MSKQLRKKKKTWGWSVWSGRGGQGVASVGAGQWVWTSVLDWLLQWGVGGLRSVYTNIRIPSRQIARKCGHGSECHMHTRTHTQIKIGECVGGTGVDWRMRKVERSNRGYDDDEGKRM